MTGSGDIDQQVKSGTFSVVLAPGAYRNLRLLVTPTAAVPIGQVRSIAIRATSSANPNKVDVIAAQVKTVTEPITAKFGGLTSGGLTSGEIRLCAGGVAVDGV